MSEVRLKRKIYDELLKWKNEYAPEYALFIKGARRVGKTTIAEDFGNKEYKSFVTINFQSANDTIRDLFVNSLLDLDYLYNVIQMQYGVKLYNRESLVILDEIQLFPKARQALKTLLADGRYDFIETGSLAGIVKKCYCLNFPELPLKGNYDDMKFKLYMADTGLLTAMLDDESQEDLRANKNLGVYKGALYESVVGEALYKQGYSLYYYKREDGTLEEDFFLRNRDNLIPVEVKAKDGKSKSLKSLINNDKYSDIEWGIKLSLNNIGFENKIYTFPYYCSFLLKEWLDKK